MNSTVCQSAGISIDGQLMFFDTHMYHPSGMRHFCKSVSFVELPESGRSLTIQ
jgi:hypothetical protein